MPIQAVAVAVAVLEAVASNGPIGVSQISRITDTPKATSQRMLATWHELGWIQKETSHPVSWSLTAKLLEIGALHSPIADLKRAAYPEMEQLAAKLGGETIHLVQRSGTNAVLIERVEGTKPVRTHYPIGGSSPLYATATGYAILSTLSAKETAELVGSDGADSIQPITKHTVTSVEQLLSKLQDGRERGYFQVGGTNHPETSAIAAPITRADGSAAGAISISLPTARVTSALASQYGEAVALAASETTKRLIARSS